MSNGERKASTRSTFHFAAGLGSGVLSAVLLQPIELLKTRVQQSGHHRLSVALAELRTSPTGLAGLWRGTIPSALRTGFGSAIYFTTLNKLRNYASHVPLFSVATTTTPSDGGHPSSSSGSSRLVTLSGPGNLAAGATARTFAGLILMPLTVIKVRYESGTYPYRSILGAGRDILRAEGPRGFFAGFGATAFRDAPYAGLYVLFYEQAKVRIGTLYGRPGKAGEAMGVSCAAAVNFSSGVLAATACSVISNPFDAIKTRIQLQPAEYRNVYHAARRMLREEGLRSFMDGLALRMSRKAMSSALAWTVYEELIRRAEGLWSPADKDKRGDVL